MASLPLFIAPQARPLRPHQSSALSLLKQSFLAGHRRAVCQLPTGAGKTRLAAEIVNGALAKGRTVAFTVPAISLIDQTVESFVNEGIDHVGVMQASHELTDMSARVQVCSVQTLAQRGCPDVDVIIVDECHQRFKVISEWMGKRPQNTFIGLSATPWARGMAEDWQDLIVPVRMQELIDAGFLSPFRVYAPSHPDLSGVKTVAGDYHEGQLAEAMGDSVLIADIVQTWLKLANWEPTLVFAVDRAHAAKLQAQFLAAGVPMGYCDAYTDRIERKVLFDKLARREIAGICNVGTLTTGVDADVRCIVLARPTKSEMLHVQIIGRGLRTAPGKENCLATGTRILTQRGLIPIEKVCISDTLWDGQQWVRHSGVISKGKQRVITYQGLTATPDHKVWTAQGWRTLGECERKKITIIQTGIGRREVRISPDRLPLLGVEGKTRRAENICPDAVRWLWRGTVDLSRELGARAHKGLSSVQSARAFPEVAVFQNAGGGAALQQPAQLPLRGLRWAWDYLRLRFSCGSSDLGSAEPWRARQSEVCANRQDRQRQGLRAGELALAFAAAQHAEPKVAKYGSNARLSDEVSTSQVCGRYTETHDRTWDDGRTDNSAMGETIGETEREVWDILNAGPRNCFTAEGLLVHNCIILDHADNNTRLGFVTDIHHDRLLSGKEKAPRTRKELGEPMPKECPACNTLKAPKVRECPTCGFTPTKQSEIEAEEGELREVTRGKPKPTMDDKQGFYSQLLAVARTRNRSKGWVSHAYKDRFKVWPRGMDEREAPPTPEVLSWVRAKDIRYAKGKGR